MLFFLVVLISCLAPTKCLVLSGAHPFPLFLLFVCALPRAVRPASGLVLFRVAVCVLLCCCFFGLLFVRFVGFRGLGGSVLWVCLAPLPPPQTAAAAPVVSRCQSNLISSAKRAFKD